MLTKNTIDTLTVGDYQKLQVALNLWRRKNPWAYGIAYDDFPQDYKNEIQRMADLGGIL